jgi:GNAT superfamily N-acetyltransferase
MSPLKREECHMRVRLLRRSDLSIATELVRQLGYDVQASDMAEHIDLLLANDTHYAAVADNGDTILGLVHAYKRPALEMGFAVVVQSLVVDRRARKSGIGKLLMAAAETWARSKGANMWSFIQALTETMRVPSTSVLATPISPRLTS